MADFIVGIPPVVQDIVQKGLLEREFHDGLFPALLFRQEALQEEWEANTGTEIFMTRPGLLTPVVDPIQPGVDPVPQTVAYEQWAARLARYAGTIDTHVPTSVVSNADQFLRNIKQLGLQAGQSLNRIPRNALFSAYLSGQTNLIAVTAAIDTTIRVAALNGFTDVIVKGTNARPSNVSSVTPLSITIDPAGTPIVRNVIGAVPDDPDIPFGPGTLQLDAAVGAVVAARTPVHAIDKPEILRAGGGASVDALSVSDVFQLQDAINASNRLRKKSVLPHEDGFYHAHISTDGNSQVFTDAVMQRLNTSLPDHRYYQEAFIGTIANIAFFLNTETPDADNSGARISTGTNAFFSKDIGAESTNETGVNVGRIVVTGRGALYEKWLDEKQYVTEAGITGKTGEFNVINQGMQIETEHIRLILRAPINRLQDQVAATWAISTSFPVPSDVTSGGPQRYKRALVIEHALNA